MKIMDQIAYFLELHLNLSVLHAPDWSFDEDELESLFNEHTKLLLSIRQTIPQEKYFMKQNYNLFRICVYNMIQLQ